MNRNWITFGWLLFATVAAMAADAPKTKLKGTLTNTTGEVTAPAELEFTEEKGKLVARLKTLPPLTGTGALSGANRDGWCELSGPLDGGFTVKFTGVLNAQSFRGTYTARPEHGQLQYGRFEFFISK